MDGAKTQAAGGQADIAYGQDGEGFGSVCSTSSRQSGHRGPAWRVQGLQVRSERSEREAKELLSICVPDLSGRTNNACTASPQVSFLVWFAGGRRGRKGRKWQGGRRKGAGCQPPVSLSCVSPQLCCVTTTNRCRTPQLSLPLKVTTRPTTLPPTDAASATAAGPGT